jgi:hypothetical protein
VSFVGYKWVCAEFGYESTKIYTMGMGTDVTRTSVTATTEVSMTKPKIEQSEVAWDDPAVMDARMRLWDLVGYLALIREYASPAELLDIDRISRASHLNWTRCSTA